jgi:hypothetical protein
VLAWGIQPTYYEVVLNHIVSNINVSDNNQAAGGATDSGLYNSLKRRDPNGTGELKRWRLEYRRSSGLLTFVRQQIISYTI